MFTSAYPEAKFPLEPVTQPSTNSATASAASTEPRFRCGFVASCNVANRAVSGNVSEGAADAKVGAARIRTAHDHKHMYAGRQAQPSLKSNVRQADTGTYCRRLQVQV